MVRLVHCLVNAKCYVCHVQGWRKGAAVLRQAAMQVPA